jgi:hypothetical protein
MASKHIEPGKCPTCAQNLHSHGESYITCDVCGRYIPGNGDPPYCLFIDGQAKEIVGDASYDACSLRCYKVLVDRFFAQVDVDMEEGLPEEDQPEARTGTWTSSKENCGSFTIAVNENRELGQFVTMLVTPESAGDPLEAIRDLKVALARATQVVGDMTAEEVLRRVFASEKEEELSTLGAALKGTH